MVLKEGRSGFTLAELLVVIAIIGMLAGFLLPVVGNARHAAKITLAKSMLSNMEAALADYFKDHGLYPPEFVDGSLDKCSETIYFYLSGMDVDSPQSSKRDGLRNAREAVKVYFDFKQRYLEDYDDDGHYEAVDPWGQPWLYVRGMYPGKPNTAGGMSQTNHGRPYHHRSSYDLYSVGPDGKTGDIDDWHDESKTFEYGMQNLRGFYFQAGDEYEDGLKPDDIANF